MFRRRFFLFALLAFLAFGAQAQSLLSRWDLGISGGGMNYLGDLNNQSMFGKVNLAGELFIRYALNDRWNIRISGAYGHLQGGNPDVINRRNLSFKSYLWEGQMRVEFNFVSFQTGGKGFKTTPFIFGGLGLFFFNPTAQYLDPATGNNIWVDLQPLGTEGQGSLQYPDRKPYQRNALMMPFGLGVKMQLGAHAALTAEYGFRKTWTDYIDDVSMTYVGADVLRSTNSNPDMAIALADRSFEVEPGYMNAPGIKRGDQSLNDWYAYFNIAISLDMELLFGWMRSKQCEIY